MNFFYKNKLTFFIFLFFILLSSSLKAQERLVEVKVEGLESLSKDLVLEVLGWKIGQEFSLKRLENSLKDLRKWGRFVDSKVLLESDGSQVWLTYQLEEGFLIKEVNIHGNYHLLEKQIKRVLFL
ncbi:MAG: hypothetical protein KDK66_06515, partial [Deltaproteobacteria bacterium]|nr:hypothetical protein [Deltaproteobacteria bacterium]